MNLFVLTKLVQAPIPDDVKFHFDGDLVTKVKTYFYTHIESGRNPNVEGERSSR